MSYTRRTGSFGKPNPPLSSVGQRRPIGAGNAFGHPGQNKQQQQYQQQNQAQQQFQNQALQQGKPKVPPQQTVQNQQTNQQNQQTNQQNQQPNQQSNQQPKQQTQEPPPQPIIQKQQQPIIQKPQQPVIQKPQQPAANVQQNVDVKPQINMQLAAEQIVAEQSFVAESKPAISTSSVEIPGLGSGNATETENVVPAKSKPFWMKRNGRINKAERAKRRNVRLRKLLQPKNALMIINELVGHVTFALSETKTGFDDVYKASVTVEGTEHVGYGKSKALAKSSAAEAAVRSMILNKLRITATSNTPSEEENKDIKMDVTNEENQEDVSWTHIASFAIHKLFTSWGDEGSMADMISRASSMGSLDGSLREGSVTGLQTQPEQKPAKKLPENAALMNPIMLLNQMHPSAKYEELGKTGSPPHIQFTIKCTVGSQSFVGIGPNKKAARKQAAFEACKTLLGIQYPPDILEGTSANKPVPMETS